MQDYQTAYRTLLTATLNPDDAKAAYAAVQHWLGTPDELLRFLRFRNVDKIVRAGEQRS